jgi:hypothetical protein
MSIRLAAWLLACAFTVTGCGGGGGDGDDGGTSAPTLVFSVPPTDQQVADGGTARFTAEAPGAVEYVWETSADGTTWGRAGSGATLSVWAFYALDGVRFRVIATGARGAVTSSPVRLTVAATAPVVVQEPADTFSTVGSSVRFEVGATGTALIYQWESSRDGDAWRPVEAATQREFQIPAVTLEQDGLLLRAVVGNTVGTRVTRTARPRLGVRSTFRSGSAAPPQA